MADFVAVIRKAVDNLQENTPENRAKVYDKARAAIRRQLEAMNPRPSDEAIQRQLAKLETAINDVDAEHVEALPPDADETEALMAELESMVGRSPAATQPVLEPAPPPPPPTLARSAPVAPVSDHAPTKTEPPVEPVSARNASAPTTKPPVLTGAAHDAAFGLGDADPAPRTAASRPASKAADRKRGKSGLVLLVLLLLIGAGAVAAWANKDRLMALLNTDPTPAPVAEVKDPEPEPAPTQPEQPAPAEPATGNAATPAAGDDNKFTQRLNADGSEPDPGPAPDLDSPTAVEGRSVAGRDEGQAEQPAEEAPVDEDTAEATTAETPVAPEETVAAPSQPLGVQQKMYLYEERLDQQTPDVFVGGVVWTLVNEPNADGVEEPVIRAEINNTEKGLSALMTIRRNSDASLPASHIIEVVFALPDGFEGGGVNQLQRINMKETEQANGNPLIAVPAQITQDFYMVALNDLPEALKFNTDMLRQRNWIDIPVVYANGRRGLITLEKGSSGVGVFNDALDAWARISGSN